MAKKMIAKLNEYKKFQQDDMVVEMATVNGANFPHHVSVRGGNSYGTGRNEHSEPHFYYSDRAKNPEIFSLTILIPTIKDWDLNKTLTIIPRGSTSKSWDGLSSYRKKLMIWMDEPHKDNPSISNFQMIRTFWNGLNAENKNVRQLID